MGTWEEVDGSVPASRGKKILPSKMVLKVKLKQNEEGVMVLNKVKARLTRSVPGRDHFETVSYMAMGKERADDAGACGGQRCRGDRA